MAMAPIFLAGALAAQPAQQTTVDQLQADRNTAGVQQIPVEPDHAKTKVDQLHAEAPVAPEAENSSPKPLPSPPTGLPEEVRRAWLIITLRGQQPTAETLMEQLGPDTMIRLFGQAALPPSILSILGASRN